MNIDCSFGIDYRPMLYESDASYCRANLVIYFLSFEMVGSVILGFIDIKNKLSITDTQCHLAGKVIHCTKVAKVLRESLNARLAYVLDDPFYILGEYLLHSKD